MSFDINAFWIMLAGSLVAVTCALLGTFLVLRKMSMVGDAISHAVLPGIIIAFMVSGSISKLPMLIGAALFGIICTLLIELLSKRGRLQSDAAIGLTFTWLFAIGVILVSLYTGMVHIDQDCVLYGEIAFVPLDVWITSSGNNLGPRNVWILASVFIFILMLIFFGYKGLLLTTFDPAYAASIGISTAIWHYVLMSAVSITTVVSFESVGAILVVAFLIGPAATAYLLTDKLKLMLIISSLLGIIAAIGGYYLASWIDGSIAAAMTVVVGLEFILAFLFSPSQGILMKRNIHQSKMDLQSNHVGQST